MLQYRQKSSKLPMGIQPVLSEASADSSGQSDTLKVIACPICRAVYISSLQPHTTTPDSLAVLESAFLSLCHACFHCQRSACPQCWNPIHHMCAVCCEEAQLPFRSPVPSLEGVIFSSQPDPAYTASFTCLHNGRYYTPDQVLPQTSSARVAARELAFSSLVIPSQPSAEQIGQSTPASSFSASPWPQEVAQQPEQASAYERPSHPSEQWQYAFPMTPSTNQVAGALAQQAQPRSTTVLTQPSQPEWEQMVQTLPRISSLPTRRTGADDYGQSLLDDLLDEDEEELSPFERIENVLIIVISTLLLAIVLMIVLAISSPTLNNLFLHFLHIDIRSEILYLLQVR